MITITNAPLSMDRIEAFCHKYSVREFALFGSILRDDFGPDSDVDLRLEFSSGRGLTFENTPDIQDDLESIFGRPVDVIEKGTIHNPLPAPRDPVELPSHLCRLNLATIPTRRNP